MTILEKLRGGLIVSCQARADNPLHGPEFMRAMALAAVRGGAVGIRAEGRDDVAAIRGATEVPLIGIRKILDGRAVYITPTLADAAIVVSAGADVVAVDATLRERDIPATELISAIRGELGIPVMADCDSIESATAAAMAGAEIVSTTLAGYTKGAVPCHPDIELIAELCQRLDIPVVAEGRLRTSADIEEAFEAGAWAVVVGTAITNPMRITERLSRVTPARRNDPEGPS